MMSLRALLLASVCTLPTVSMAQWVWLDHQGRRVYSDQMPPPDIPTKNVLKQPGVKGTPTAPEPVAAAAPAASAASAPALSGKDKQLEEKKKQAEAAQAEKKKAAEEAAAAARAENCARSRRAKATFDSGVRIAQTNDKGEREILDDKQRATEVKRLESLIARDCAAQPQ